MACRLALALGTAALALALPAPARAQLQVSVTTRDVDEDDPQCFLHGTLGTQDIDVANPGATPVLATLDCRVLGGELRVAAKTPPLQIAPGATERMQCSLFDFQDPPADGSVVSFDVDVNGAVSSHSVTVRCRPTQGPLQQCAAARLGALASACSKQVAALASYAQDADAAAFERRLARAGEKLARRFEDAEAGSATCPAEGGLGAAGATLSDLGASLMDFVSQGGMGRCGAAKLRAVAKKCGADLRAWRRLGERGDPAALEQALARSDLAFERGWARATRSDSCPSQGEREVLRLLADRAADTLAGGQGLQRFPGHAELLRSSTTFLPGQREKRLWLPLPGSGDLLFDGWPDLHAVTFDRDGGPVSVGGEFGAVQEPEAVGLPLEGPADSMSIVLRRSGDLRESRTVPLGVVFDDPALAWADDASFDAMIYSPRRSFPFGLEVTDLPIGPPFGSFEDWVAGEWGWSYAEGLPALLWYPLAELGWWRCPAGAGTGPRPPQGAGHGKNYCAISAFIHSMDRKFPGALAPDVSTDPKKWDEVGGWLGHVNLFGTPGSTLVGAVNEILSGAFTDYEEVSAEVVSAVKKAVPSRTRDGKFYCAGKLVDVRAFNLARWAEDCDLKLLVYDFSALFGHWVDVTGVTPDPLDAASGTLGVQDYEAAYSCGYEYEAGSGAREVDFSGIPATSAMAEGFGPGNPIAGDALDEPVGFSVVCECDRTDPLNPKLPTQTKSGKPLNP